MFKSLLCILTTTVSIVAQTDFTDQPFSVLDNYYSGILYPEDSNHTVSDRINYPGLFKDSASSISAGYLSDNSEDSGIKYSHFRDLYGWAEEKTSIGILGIWIGDIDLNDSKSKSDTPNKSLSEDQNTSIKGILWFSPLKESFFKGISLEFFGDHNLNSSEGSNFDGYYFLKNKDKFNYKNLAITCLSLFSIGKSNYLRIGFSGYNMILDNETSDEISYQDELMLRSNFQKYETRGKSGEFLVGYFNKKGRQLNLIVSSNADNTKHTDNSINETSRYGDGRSSFYIDYSEGRLLKYQKHRVYLGIKAYLEGYFPILMDSSKITFKDLIHEAKHDKNRIDGSISTPVILDISLFNSNIYTVFKIVPELYAYRVKNYYNSILLDRKASVRLSEIALGLKGKIGNQLEFTLIPSIQSKIFVTGFELKYLFDSKKRS